MKAKFFNILVVFIILTSTVSFAQEPTDQVFTIEAPTATLEPTETEISTATLTPTPEVTVIVVPPVEPAPPERVDHNLAVTIVINTVVGFILAAFGSAPVTVVITSILKKIKGLDSIPAEHLSFGTAAVLYVLAFGASAVGYQVQFEGLLETVVVVAPALVSFITTLVAAPTEYHVAKALDVPVIGESRDRELGWK